MDTNVGKKKQKRNLDMRPCSKLKKKRKSKKLTLICFSHCLYSMVCRCEAGDGNSLLKVGTREFNHLQSCCHSNYIFTRGFYLQYPSCLSQNIWFLLGLNSTKSLKTWTHQTVSVSAELKVYPKPLPFELRRKLNQMNGQD